MTHKIETNAIAGRLERQICSQSLSVPDENGVSRKALYVVFTMDNHSGWSVTFEVMKDLDAPFVTGMLSTAIREYNAI